MRLRWTSRWLSSRPTRSPSKCRRRRRACSARSRPRTARRSPSARCSGRSPMVRRAVRSRPRLPPRRPQPPLRLPRRRPHHQMRRWRLRFENCPLRAASMPRPFRDRGGTDASPRAICWPRSRRPLPRRRRSISQRLRQTIARRLKDVQNTAAMLTTFNEVDMTHIMAMRAQYKDVFEKKHGSKLGFMGFFTKAVVQALKDIPAVNAEIDGSDLIYKNYYHIGVAVGTDKGLVVPVVRDCDQKSIADIEKGIADFGRRARDGQLKIDEMQGGTFTITNGGIYGSLMSTPILNAPQSGILGMHKIQERPMVVGGKIEARPMMYLALTYDHRIVDGRDAVQFLVHVKDLLEDPARLLLEI